MNAAGIAELRLLPGVGDQLAERILAQRRDKGPFARVDDLRKVPGVVAVYTAHDFGTYWQPGPLLVVPPPIAGIVFNPRTQVPLVKTKARHVGEPVAMVVAESRYIAEDAVAKIAVDWEVLEAVVDLERALDKKSPVLHDDLGSNIAIAGHYLRLLRDACCRRLPFTLPGASSRSRCGSWPRHRTGCRVNPPARLVYRVYLACRALAHSEMRSRAERSERLATSGVEAGSRPLARERERIFEHSFRGRRLR